MDPKRYEINKMEAATIVSSMTNHGIAGWLFINGNYVRSSDIKVVKVEGNNCVQYPSKPLPRPSYPDRLGDETDQEWKARVDATSFSADYDEYESAPYLYCVTAGGFTVAHSLLEESANNLAHILVTHLSGQLTF